jgi:beta-glucosidase
MVQAASGADFTVVVGYNAEDEGEYAMPSFQTNPEPIELFPPPDGSDAANAVMYLLLQAGQDGDENAEEQFGGEMGKGGDRTSIRLPEQFGDTSHSTNSAGGLAVG